MIKTQILLQKVKMQGQRIMFKCIKKEKKGILPDSQFFWQIQNDPSHKPQVSEAEHHIKLKMVSQIINDLCRLCNRKEKTTRSSHYFHSTPQRSNGSWFQIQDKQ